MTPDRAALLEPVDTALAADADHLDPAKTTEADMTWLVAQLACWPWPVEYVETGPLTHPFDNTETSPIWRVLVGNIVTASTMSRPLAILRTRSILPPRPPDQRPG